MTTKEMEIQIHQFAEMMYKTGYEDGQKDWHNVDVERDKAYKKGFEDAWECARKIMQLPNDTQELFYLSAEEAIAKIKEYEEYEEEQKNKIKLWDEVIIKRSSFGFNGHKGVVTKILGDNLFEVMLNYGTIYNYDTSSLEKTDKSYSEFSNILEQLRGENNDN